MKALTFQGEGDVKVVDAPKPAIKGSRDLLVRVTLGAVHAATVQIVREHALSVGQNNNYSNYSVKNAQQLQRLLDAWQK